MTEEAPEDNPYAALKIRDFRFFLFGRLFVQVAVQIQALASGWQIYEITKNPLVLGLIGLAEALPAICISLYAGHVADIHDRRKIALSAVFAIFICIGSLCLGSHFLTGAPLLICLFSVIALSGIARGFYGPGIFGMLSDIVPRHTISNAAAWNSATWQGSAMAGPVIGGFLYNYLGVVKTYGLSSLLLLGSFFCFLSLKTSFHKEAKEAVSAIANIKEGLKFVFSNEILLGAMSLDLFAVLFGGAVALLPIFSAEVYHMGPEALGFLRAAPSLGALITASLLTHMPIKSNAGAIFLSCVAGFGLTMIAFALSSNFYVSLVVLALSGVLDGVSVYIRSTIYQLVTPDDMKGRVSSVNNIFIGSSNEIGEFESGVAARFLGLIPSVVFGGSMTLLVVLITAFKAPNLRKLHLQNLYLKQD